MLVKTTKSNQVWQSPDRQKTIWEVNLRADNGNTYELKTYSPAIAEKGFEGDVESYMNNRGDRFVRQAVKEHQPLAGDSRDMSIRAQWAIGQAIALASATMDKRKITMPVIEEYAKELFETVSKVKGEELPAEDKREGEGFIARYTRSQPQGA